MKAEAVKARLRKADGFAGELSIVLPDPVIRDIRNNPLINSLFITDIGYYPNARHHFRARPQGVDQYILIYVVAGEGSVVVRGKRHRLRENQFFIIPANAPHEYVAKENDPWSIYWLHFKGDRAGFHSEQFGRVTTIEPTSTSRIEYRINLFREIIYCLGMGFYRENLEYANLCLCNLLAAFLYIPQFRYFNQQSPQDLIERVILYMKSNLERRVSLNELSAEFRLSVAQLSKLFSQRTKTSPIDYFINLKIQRACQLLDFTDLRVKAISMELGYDDPYYFSRLFKKVMGIAPSQYRERDG